MKLCVMNAKSTIIQNFARAWSHDLLWVKETVADFVFREHEFIFILLIHEQHLGRKAIYENAVSYYVAGSL